MRAAGPVVDPVPCSGCGRLIDPLRAGHVAIFDLRFHYFCDRGGCRTAFLGDAGEEPSPTTAARIAAGLDPDARRPQAEIDRLAARAAPIEDAFPPAGDDGELPPVPSPTDSRLLVEPIGKTILSEAPPRADADDPRDAGPLLLVIAVVAGTLAVALALAGDALLVVGARLVLVGVGAGMLVGRGATTARDPVDARPLPVIASSIAALLVAAWAAVGRDRPLAAEAASLAGIVVTASAVSAWLAEHARKDVAAERGWIAEALAAPARRVDEPGAFGGDAPRTMVFDVHPGEQVLVEAGEVVPVDLEVTSGEADVLPWASASTRVRRRAGDAVVAGARVVRGRLRGTCTWAGNDRAYARVLLDPRRRADALSPIAQAARGLAERWSAIAAIVGAISTGVAGRSKIEVAMAAVAVHAALSAPLIAALPALHVARGILLGLRRGICFRSADALDRAGRVSLAVFCARGTLLLGEPELAEVEAVVDRLDAAEVLALAAGAERTGEHPIATALVRAARSRGVRPDGVRNPTATPGLGVTAVASSGEELCVGNRGLLQQRISIASAEQRIAELEAHGRAVVLVALGGRLVGLLALQDGLRPGARAAVQHLLDAQVEPVLMSGDARETCEAIARSLDIDHVRPDVLPADRGAEVRRLVEAGTSVAVLGHAGADEPALAAAEVAVALGAAGTAPGDHAVALASEDVRDAALSLALAKRARIEARVGLALAAVPALIGSVAVGFGILPPAYAPIASLLGGAMAVAHARALDRMHRLAAAPAID